VSDQSKEGASNDETDMRRERMRFIKSRERTFLVDRLWQVMDDPESSAKANYYEKFMCALITISVFSALLQTLNYPPWTGLSAAVFETIVDAIFAGEIIVRFIACPNRKSFCKNMYNIVDVASGLPIILRLYLNFQIPLGREACSYPCLVLKGLVPLVRLLKMLRRFQQFHLLLKAFSVAIEALPVMVFIYILIALGFTAMIYVVEPASNVDSFTTAWWLAIVSMTTLGYGDKYPDTDAGRLVVTIFVFTSTMYMAIPLGIIGNAFNDVWKDRDHILLMERTRTRLQQAGYTPQDIPILFKLFDCDRNGQLDITEFRWMLQGMRLGLKKNRVIELYEAFDDDKSGGIDPNEFIKALFPDAYYEIFGDPRLERNTSIQSIVLEDGEEVASKGPSQMLSPIGGMKSSVSSGRPSFDHRVSTHEELQMRVSMRLDAPK